MRGFWRRVWKENRLEMAEENSLRLKLELLKKDLARKQKKIEKLDRSKTAKEHVKKKLEEQQTKVGDGVEEVFTPHSARRGQLEKAEGATSKMKTTLVSFNLAKSETTNKETPKTKTHSSNNKVSPKLKARELLTNIVPDSQDDFKESPLLNIQENGKGEIGRRISKKRRSLTTSRKLSHVPATHSKPAAPQGKTTEQASPKELPKSHVSPLSSESDDKTSPPKPSYFCLNGPKRNSTSAAEISPSTVKPALGSDKRDKSYDQPSVQESPVSSLSSVTPITKNKTRMKNSRSDPVNNNDTPDDVKKDHSTPEHKAIITAEPSPDTVPSRDSAKPKRKSRRSTTDLDFSFLDEEGDMYSQIKTRRSRRSNQSSQASQAEMFALSQEEYPTRSESPVTKQLMPKIGQGLSQDQTPPPSRSRLQFAGSPSPLVNSWPMMNARGPGSPTMLSPVPSSLPPQSKSSKNSSKKLKLKLPESGTSRVRKKFTLPDPENGQQMGQKVTDPICIDSNLKQCMDTLESSAGPGLSSQRKKRTPKVSGKLMQLPPKSICEKVSDFSLPDTEYEELKLTKVSSHGKDTDISNSAALSSERKLDPTPGGTTTPRVKSQENVQLVDSQKMDNFETQKSMRKVSSTAKRRRSRKLSPILKVTDDASSTFSSQDTLIYSESPITSQLNDAMIGEFPPEDEVIQRKLSRRSSQTSTGRSRKTKKKTIHVSQGSSIESETQHSTQRVIETCGATEQAYVEATVPIIAAETEKSESQTEDMLNIGILNDSVSYTSTSQASSECEEFGPNGLRKMDCVKLQSNRLDVRSIDAVSGYMGSDRATITVLAGPSWIQLWCQKERQPWDLVHEWEATEQLVEDVQVLTTGDVMAVMTITTSCVEVYVYSSGRTWNFTVCHKNSTSNRGLLCCKSSMSLLLAEVTKCSSGVIKYKMREDWTGCDAGSVVGDISDCLVSLMTVRGQQGAVLGTSATHAYIWNHNRAALLVQIPIPVNTDTCLTSIAEHGLIFMWVSVLGELPCLLVANPNTARCIISGSLEPGGKSSTSLSSVHADTERVVAVSLDGQLSTWDAVSGALRTKVALTERPACLTLVQHTASRCVIVTTTGCLQAHSLSV